MALIANWRMTSNTLADRYVVEMKDSIFLLDESRATPIYLISSKMNKETCHHYKFNWINDAFINRDLTVSGAHTTETTITLAASESTKASIYDLYKTPNGETLLVTAIPATNQITVTRSWGATAVANIDDASVLYHIGNAHPEVADARPMKTTLETTDYNYTQNFQTVFGAARRQENSKLYGGPDRPYQRKKNSTEHLKEIEWAIICGERALDTTNFDSPISSTGGVEEFITTNTTTSVGALNESDIESFCQTGFRYNTGQARKAFFCSRLIASGFNLWGRGKLQTVVGSETYGIKVTKYLNVFGDMDVITHDLLATTTNGRAYGGYGFLLDMKKLGVRVHAGGDTRLEANIQDNATTAWKDRWISDVGLMRGAEQHHALMSGVTSVAA